MLSALAFNIIPTVFEVGLVTGILVCMYVCVSFSVSWCPFDDQFSYSIAVRVFFLMDVVFRLCHLSDL